MDYEYQEDVEVNLRAGIGHILMVVENQDRTGWYGSLFSPGGDASDPDRFDPVEFRTFATAAEARRWCDLRDRELSSVLIDEIEAFLAG